MWLGTRQAVSVSNAQWTDHIRIFPLRSAYSELPICTLLSYLPSEMFDELRRGVIDLTSGEETPVNHLASACPRDIACTAQDAQPDLAAQVSFSTYLKHKSPSSITLERSCLVHNESSMKQENRETPEPDNKVPVPIANVSFFAKEESDGIKMLESITADETSHPAQESFGCKSGRLRTKRKREYIDEDVSDKSEEDLKWLSFISESDDGEFIYDDSDELVKRNRKNVGGKRNTTKRPKKRTESPGIQLPEGYNDGHIKIDPKLSVRPPALAYPRSCYSGYKFPEDVVDEQTALSIFVTKLFLGFSVSFVLIDAGRLQIQRVARHVGIVCTNWKTSAFTIHPQGSSKERW